MLLFAGVVVTASCGSNDESNRSRDRRATGGTGAASGAHAAGAAAGAHAAGAAASDAGRPPSHGGNGDGGSDRDGNAASGGTAGMPQANAGETGFGGGFQAGNGGAPADSRLHGRVVDIDTGRPLAGRTVVVARDLNDADPEQTTTDARGAFTLPNPGGVYDALVLEGDGSAVTIYQGLTLQNPVLTHRWARSLTLTSRLAQVRGNISGGTTFPLSDPGDVVAVHLFTPESTERYLMGAGGPPFGPEYVTNARFNSSELLPSTVVTLGTFGRKADMPQSAPAYTAFAATQTFELYDGDVVANDIALEPVELGEISGAVALPAGRHVTEMREYYRYPYPGAVLDFPAADYVRKNPVTAGGDFAFELPVLEDAGASLCLVGMSDEIVGMSDEADSLWTERCGLSLGDDAVSIELQAAPVLSEPTADATVDATTHYAWSAFERGIYDLELWPDEPARGTPGITIMTTATDLVLPDLSAWNLSLPKSETYHVTLFGRGVYVSMDEAFGARGVGAVIPAEGHVSAAAAVDVTTSP